MTSPDEAVTVNPITFFKDDPGSVNKDFRTRPLAPDAGPDAAAAVDGAPAAPAAPGAPLEGIQGEGNAGTGGTMLHPSLIPAEPATPATPKD